MTSLNQQQCEACRADAPRVTEDEKRDLHEQVPEWEIMNVDGIERLQRVFRKENFVAAIEFTNRVAGLAEEQGHHPSILTEWGRVTVTWWSKKIKGLHVNDFIMAAKTDGLEQG